MFDNSAELAVLEMVDLVKSSSIYKARKFIINGMLTNIKIFYLKNTMSSANQMIILRPVEFLRKSV